MKKEMTLEEMKLEMDADKDVRHFIEMLQVWYDKLTEEGKTSGKEICDRLAMNPSFLSRTLNGRNGNPNLLTLAKIFRAMELRLEPNVQRISDLQSARSNSVGSSTYDDALWRLAVSSSALEFNDSDHFAPRRHIYGTSGKPSGAWKQQVNVKTREISNANA